MNKYEIILRSKQWCWVMIFSYLSNDGSWYSGPPRAMSCLILNHHELGNPQTIREWSNSHVLNWKMAGCWHLDQVRSCLRFKNNLPISWSMRSCGLVIFWKDEATLLVSSYSMTFFALLVCWGFQWNYLASCKARWIHETESSNGLSVMPSLNVVS